MYCKGNESMKKLLTLLLTAATVFTCTAAVFADDVDRLTLIEGSPLVLDRESGYIERIDGETDVYELALHFDGHISVLGSNGETKDVSEPVASDDVVVCGGDSLKALIYGDVDRNGKINLSDLLAMLKHLSGWGVDICLPAANVAYTAEGKVDLEDAVKLLRSIAEWDDISLGDVRLVYVNEPVIAEAEDSTLDLYFCDMMYKSSTTNTEHTGEYAHKIKMAQNENEGCQALLYSENDREGLSAELTPFTHEYGDAQMESKLEWINYYKNHNLATTLLGADGDAQIGGGIYGRDEVEWEFGDYPEVVLDMAETFELSAGKVQHFVITAYSETGTPAGMYTATLNIKDGDKVIKTATVYAYVWDFALPDRPYSASLIANGSYNYEGNPDPNPVKTYYDYMLDNNLSSYVLPYEITDPRADEYMNDPRVTAFVIAGGGHMYGDFMYGGLMDRTDEETVANYRKVSSYSDWMSKGLFYYTDEPYDNRLRFVKSTYEYVTNLLGVDDIRNITPLAGNDGFSSGEELNMGVDSVAYIDPYINVWCPQSNAYHLSSEGGKWTSRRFLSKYGEYADRAKAFKEKGEETWWYVCCSPEFPYANLFTWYQGVVIRDLMWQQYFNDVDGFLYYGVGVHWDNISKYQFDIYNGDGVLLYPGEFWGRRGPQASWRLYQLRDGFDDFDYLSMAEEIVGRDKVMEIVNTVTSGMFRYTEDYTVLEAARDELAKIILSAPKPQ